jgi:hypothetical protein
MKKIPKPLAPKLVVPENPDDESVKMALFTVIRRITLQKAARRNLRVLLLLPVPFEDS